VDGRDRLHKARSYRPAGTAKPVAGGVHLHYGKLGKTEFDIVRLSVPNGYCQVFFLLQKTVAVQ
jgi:hypothetical protein